MKKILFAVLAFGALVACTNEEVIEIDREAIEFGDAFVDNGTRATDPSFGSTNLVKEFQVWGNIEGIGTNDGTYTEVFRNEKVYSTKDDDTAAYQTAWYCDKVEYWIYGATYNFAAVFGGTVADDDLVNCLPSKISYTADGTTDLIYAQALDETRTRGGDAALVKFTFDHLLSKVKFTFSNSTPDNTNYTFAVKNLSINTPATGTVAVPATVTEDVKQPYAWTPGADETLGFTFTDKVGTTALVCDSEKLVIPTTYVANALTVSFDLDWYYKGTYVSTETGLTVKNIEAITLESGKAYNFKMQYGVNQPIQFTVEKVNAWDDNSGAGNNVDLN